MEKSQRQVSGKAIPRAGHQRKLIAISSLAILAAGIIILGLANLWPGYLPVNLSESDCNQEQYDGHPQTCASVAASTGDKPLSDSLVAASAPGRGSISEDDANRTRRGNRVQGPRAWQDDPSTAQSLQPGYTMAELCSVESPADEFRCQILSYDGIDNVSVNGVASQLTSDHKISGHVMTAEGVGLSGVTIVASPKRLNGDQQPKAEGLRFWTITDPLGAYSLNGLAEGEYTIRSRNQGTYRSARIDVRTGVNYADLVVTRNLATVTEGQVLTARGEPLEGVTVLPVLLGQPSVLTDYEGRFRLPVTLKPTVNSYSIRFQRPGYQEQTATIDVWYGEAFNASDLSVIMDPVESWTAVSGQVSNDSGEPLAGRKVELRSRSAQQTHKTTTDVHGNYTFPFVEFPADYQLIVFGGIDHKDSQHSLYVSADMDSVDVVAESYEFGEVTGKLVNPNGIPVPDFELVVRNTASRKPNALVSTDAYGNFQIAAAPAGELVVASQSTPSFLVQGLHLESGDKLHVPLVLDWGEHEIRGIVLDAHDNPVPASRVVLQWSHQAEGITTRATRRTASDMQGHFAFNNLGPGPHSLRIDAPGFKTLDTNHDLSRQGYDLTLRLN
jgi:hypothetical protein